MSPRLSFFLLATALLGACGDATPAETQAVLSSSATDRIARIDVAVIGQTSTELSFELTGEIEGSRDASLASAFGGYVEKVSVKLGDQARKGKLLVSIDRQLNAATVAQAEAQHTLAKNQAERMAKLGEGISSSELDAAQTQALVTKASLDQARVRLRRASITAPFDGVITQVGVEVGEIATPGAPVIRLVQLDPVKVSVSVSDRDIVTLTEGQQVSVTTAAQSKMHQGIITSVGRAADLRTRAFTVEIEVPNPDGALLPGMIARVRVQSSLSDGLVLPLDWIITKNGEHGVFVEADGLVSWRTLTLGKIAHNQVAVDAGLQDGERVVIVGHRNLLDGDRVLVSRTGVCCTAGRATF